MTSRKDKRVRRHHRRRRSGRHLRRARVRRHSEAAGAAAREGSRHLRAPVPGADHRLLRSLLPLRHHHGLGRGGGLLRRQADPELRSGRLVGGVRGCQPPCGLLIADVDGVYRDFGAPDRLYGDEPEMLDRWSDLRRRRACGWCALRCGIWAPSARRQCSRPCGPNSKRRSTSSTDTAVARIMTTAA